MSPSVQSRRTPAGVQGSRRLFTALLVAIVLTGITPVVEANAAAHWAAVASTPGGVCDGAVARGGDGRIYSFCEGSNEAFAPSTNTWRAFAPDPVLRSGFAVAEGVHGAILVVGGYDDRGNSLGTAEFYSPSHNRWTQVAPMPTPRSWLALAFASGRFYAFGGADEYGFNPMSTVEAFNPSTNTWSTVSDSGLNSVCNLGAVTGGDGRIYVIGGMEYNCNTEQGWKGLNNVSAYSPASDTWTPVASLPADHGYVGRSAFGMTVGSDGRIYVIGGIEGSDCCRPGNRGTPTVLRYTISTNRWTFIASLPTLGDLYHSGGAANSAGSHGKVYSIRGDENDKYAG